MYLLIVKFNNNIWRPRVSIYVHNAQNVKIVSRTERDGQMGRASERNTDGGASATGTLVGGDVVRARRPLPSGREIENQAQKQFRHTADRIQRRYGWSYRATVVIIEGKKAVLESM